MGRIGQDPATPQALGGIPALDTGERQAYLAPPAGARAGHLVGSGFGVLGRLRNIHGGNPQQVLGPIPEEANPELALEGVGSHDPAQKHAIRRGCGGRHGS